MSSLVTWPDRAEILLYYDRMLEALRALQGRFVQVTADPDSQFYAMTRPEFDEALRVLRDELDAQVTMMVVASADAALRVDCKLRVKKKAKKDPLWVALDSLTKAEAAAGQKGVRVGKLLLVWKKETGEPLKTAFDLLSRRHWLAHGRSWADGSGVPVDPRQASRIIDDLFRKLNAFKSDFPLR